LFGGHQTLRVADAEARRQDVVGDADAVSQVPGPVDGNAERRESRAPAGEVYVFGVGQDPVEIEEQSVVGQSSSGLQAGET
jgi:hypothetical protein